MNRMRERVEWLMQMEAEVLPKATLNYFGPPEKFEELLTALYWANYGVRDAIDLLSELFQATPVERPLWRTLIGMVDQNWRSRAEEIESRK